jgi:hypothetical protein
MMGLKDAITPVVTGTVICNISGYITASVTTANVGIQYRIAFGTGAAPARGAAATGKVVGMVQQYDTGTTLTAIADLKIPFSISALITGLALHTAIWTDLQVEAITTANSSLLNNLNCVLFEVN